MDQKSIIDATQRLKQAVDNNSQPTPYLSVDPETETPVVVGDPNNIPLNKGEYTLVFMYSEEEISADDKAKMEYIE